MGYKFNPFTGNLDTTDSPNGVFEEIEVNGDITLDDGGTYTTTLQTITPTANRTVSIPNATGTVGLVGGSSGNLTFNNAGAYAGVANSSVDNATGNITLGSRFISSLNGALSATGIAGVPVAATGTWITGGTATTTKPQVLIEPTGTTSTAWSTSGTGLGVNAASAFTGRLLDLQVNGTSQAIVTGLGQLLAGTSSALSAGLLDGTTHVSNSAPKFQAASAFWDQPCFASYNYQAASSVFSQLVFNRATSNVIGTIGAAISNNVPLGGITFSASDGSKFVPAALIRADCDGTAGTNDMPGRLVFSTTADSAASPTERLRITSTGQVRLAGAGITFNGDTAAANELDDYEEGTWTPSLGGNTTYNYQQGNYTKIGRFVYIRGALGVATLGTGSTTNITALPFAAGSITGRFGGSVYYFDSTAVNVLNLTVFLNASTVSFSNISAAGTGTTDSPAIFGNSASVQFSVCYQV